MFKTIDCSLCPIQDQERKHSIHHLLCTRSAFIKSASVSVAASETEVFFIEHGMKVNELWHLNISTKSVRCCTNHVVDDNFVSLGKISHPRIVCATQFSCCRAKLSPSFSWDRPQQPTYYKIRESHSSRSIMAGIHYPCSRPWTRASFLTPVFTGRVGHQHIAGVNTGRVHGCPKITPVFTAVGHGREHGPCSRAVNTGVQNDARVHGPWTRVVCTKLKSRVNMVEEIKQRLVEVWQNSNYSTWVKKC